MLRAPAVHPGAAGRARGIDRPPSPPHADAARLRGLEFVQTIALPPGYDRLGENSSARTQAPAAADATAAPPVPSE